MRFGVGMDLPSETLILIVAVVVAAAVAFLELRYLRTKKHVKVDQYLEQDDAYNAVTTTRAVAASLTKMGKDTSEADVIIYQAETAYDRREFVRCLELVGKAKTALKSCRDKDLLTAPVEEPMPADKDQTKEESKAVPANECKKMPQNYLESKFIIDSVKSLLPDAFVEQREAGQKEIDIAQERFDAGDYSEALKAALRAKRIISPPAPSKDRIPNVATEVIKAQPAPKGSPSACVNCGAGMSPVDDFCPSCGTKAGLRICKGCQAVVTTEDMFCRRCGVKVDR
ncbi:MAG: zinc ribbon domain-containing protein [Methanomassiliicoccus sp.]|nr:zinc ribbon domain-containing protein [Methanomassiliicoccus sp.]